jgi:major membrane immunogen (membrane-anchored lipoprotein)
MEKVKVDRNDNKDDKLKLMIEDRINRFNFEFVRPSKDVHSDDILYAQGMKGMMAKGPELRLQIVPSRTQEEKEAAAIKIRVFRGKKKNVFKDDILVSDSDAERLKRFIKDNFAR